MNPCFVIRTAMVLAILPASVPAAEDDGREKPAVTASLVPVGGNSDAYWVGEGPGIRAIALDPGAAPPSTLAIRDRKGIKTIPTILNRPSPALPVRGGLLRILAGPGADADAELPTFAEFRIPDTPGHYDIFLNRAPNRDDWEKAESLILPASITEFPSASLRLVNLSPVPVKWKVGNEVVDLAPRQAKVVSPNVGNETRMVAVQAAHMHGDSHRIILRTGIRIGAAERANLVVYPGRKPDKPCEVTWYYQSDPASDNE